MAFLILLAHAPILLPATQKMSLVSPVWNISDMFQTTYHVVVQSDSQPCHFRQMSLLGFVHRSMYPTSLIACAICEYQGPII